MCVYACMHIHFGHCLGCHNQFIFTQAFPSLLLLHSVKLLSLVFEMARYSTSFMLQLVQLNATELLAYLLEKVYTYSLVKAVCNNQRIVVFAYSTYLP